MQIYEEPGPFGYMPSTWKSIEHMHTALHEASPEFSRMFRFILISHSNPHLYPADEFGRTPIHYAAMLRDRKSVEFYLFNKLYDINWMDCLGETALAYMIHMWNRTNEREFLDMVVLLLSHGANPNLSSHGSLTPLMHAVMIENPTLVECLLIAGANPHQKLEESGLFLKRGETALSLATRLNNVCKTNSPLTANQLHIIYHLVQFGKSSPEYIFHALQQTTNPLMKKYLTECMWKQTQQPQQPQQPQHLNAPIHIHQ